MSNLTEK